MQFHRSVPKHSTTLYWLNMKRKKVFFEFIQFAVCFILQQREQIFPNREMKGK